MVQVHVLSDFVPFVSAVTESLQLWDYLHVSISLSESIGFIACILSSVARKGTDSPHPCQGT